VFYGFRFVFVLFKMADEVCTANGPGNIVGMSENQVFFLIIWYPYLLGLGVMYNYHANMI